MNENELLPAALVADGLLTGLCLSYRGHYKPGHDEAQFFAFVATRRPTLRFLVTERTIFDMAVDHRLVRNPWNIERALEGNEYFDRPHYSTKLTRLGVREVHAAVRRRWPEKQQ